MTTTKNGFRVDDITFRGARKQSEIENEIEKDEVEEVDVKAPVSLTPEQVKDYYKTKIALAKDSNEKRREYLSLELLAQLKPLGIPMEAYKDEIRLLFPRDRALTDRKQKMAATVASFEKARKYTGHIIIDVDPA